MNTQDQVMTCADCGGQFHWSGADQDDYAEQGYAPPKRCKPCRQAKKAQRESDDQRGGKK